MIYGSEKSWKKSHINCVASISWLVLPVILSGRGEPPGLLLHIKYVCCLTDLCGRDPCADILHVDLSQSQSQSSFTAHGFFFSMRMGIALSGLWDRKDHNANFGDDCLWLGSIGIPCSFFTSTVSPGIEKILSLLHHGLGYHQPDHLRASP